MAAFSFCPALFNYEHFFLYLTFTHPHLQSGGPPHRCLELRLLSETSPVGRVTSVLWPVQTTLCFAARAGAPCCASTSQRARRQV